MFAGNIGVVLGGGRIMSSKGSRGWESLTVGGRRLRWQSEDVRVAGLQGSCLGSKHTAALGHCHYQSVDRGDDGISSQGDEAMHLRGPLWKGSLNRAAVDSNPSSICIYSCQGALCTAEMELTEQFVCVWMPHGLNKTWPCTGYSLQVWASK